VGAQAALARDPHLYLLQQYLPLSMADGRILDFRLHSLITSDRVWVSPVPISRSTPLEGDGRVNVHQGGSVAPVFVLGKTSALPRSRPAIWRLGRP
jgi:hypothetical protein